MTLASGERLTPDLTFAQAGGGYCRQFRLAVANRDHSLIISGTGDVIEPEHDIIAIGSGGAFARAAARALLAETNLGPEAIVRRGLAIASEICVYTNDQVTIEALTG